MKETMNVETTKFRIENESEMSEAQRINAYLASHAVEHYCAALGLNSDEMIKATENVVNCCEKEPGVHWLYTCPAIDGKNADGTNQPTKEEWKDKNPSAVELGRINGKVWFKRPFIIGDARGVRSIGASFTNYSDAIKTAKEREMAKIQAAAAVLGVDVETLLALKNK